MKNKILNEKEKYFIPENKYQEFKRKLNKKDNYLTIDEWKKILKN